MNTTDDKDTEIQWQNLPKNAESVGIALAALPKTERPLPILDVMIDIETLSTEDNAVILQIGAASKFINPSIAQGTLTVVYVETCDSNEQIDYRTVSGDTLLWWSKKDQELYNSLCSGKTPLEVCLRNLTTYIESLPVPVSMCRFISKGNFDFRILEHAYKQAGLSCPWKYWQCIDMRSLLSVFTSVVPTKPTQAHNALSDAIAQLQTMQAINALVAIVNKER